jgi:hypothetical protein
VVVTQVKRDLGKAKRKAKKKIRINAEDTESAEDAEKKREEGWCSWIVRAHPYKPRVGHPQVLLMRDFRSKNHDPVPQKTGLNCQRSIEERR